MKMSSGLVLLLTSCVRQGIRKCPCSKGEDDEREDTTDAPIANVSINCAWACCQSQAVEEREDDAAAMNDADVSSSNRFNERVRMLDRYTKRQWHHHGGNNNDQPGANNFYLQKRNSF